MGVGSLTFELRAGNSALPVPGAQIVIRDAGGTALRELTTDESGNTSSISLSAPDKANSLDASSSGPFYATYQVDITHPGYITYDYHNVQIFDGVNAILPVTMLPLEGSVNQEIDIPPTAVSPDHGTAASPPQTSPRQSRVLREVVIPDYITVHLGPPSAQARDVRVPFTDYLKNVASSEIYPTWPQTVIEANIYAQITFGLNRIYTEWYHSKGYSFDITNSTAYDQAFVENRDIFANISQTVDNVFNQYVRRQGLREPYFTQFCNGTTSTCAGLSQWGTVGLANQGLTPLQILRFYYPEDVELVESTNIAGATSSYPGLLRQGSTGDDVLALQRHLSRIRADYPLIPPVVINGVFDEATANAVRIFQSIFALTQDGVVGKDTWYKVSSIYVAVTKLADLSSEGERIGIGPTPPSIVLNQGAEGQHVVELQFILNYISDFYPSVPPVNQDSTFGATTKTSVIAFQQEFKFTADGIVGAATWRNLYQVYRGIEDLAETPPSASLPPLYPGVLIQSGSQGESIRLIQAYLRDLAVANPSLPSLTADGIFGPNTKNSVQAFHRFFGLISDGIIGPTTWQKIVVAHQELASRPQYPGYLLRLGSRGDEVRLMQQYLQAIATVQPSIPSLVADGIFGSGTQASVVAFQRAFDLTADGLIGPKAWDSIASATQRL